MTNRRAISAVRARVLRRAASAAAALMLAGLLLAACSGGGGKATPTTVVTPPPSVATTPELPTRHAGSPAASSSPLPPPAADGYRAVQAFPELNFDQMLGLQVIPGDERHALLLTQDGMIRRADLRDSPAAPTTFMDIRDRIIRNPGMEEGLLGLAFSPDYAQSGKFYLYYSAGDPRRAVISRFVASGDHADPATEHVLLEIGEPFANHNGGAMAFGPDGELYLGVGDGGSGGDPNRNGQNRGTLLGKILRIDVSGEDYAVPSNNPFKSPDRPEIWAYGLRNPWRISFDPEDGRLWVADVGQNKWEEVDVVERGGNYGWNVMEGNHCFKPASGCDETGLIRPVAEFDHGLGCSVTGGFVYHGASMPELRGWYLYGDFCSGRVWALNAHGGPGSEPVQLANTGASIASFAQDAAGEPYLVTFDKKILKLERL
ncbi:MAG: glucose sorbosone dehydrogenase [Dehalococcoidia bacterium]|nr:MAG: glucose sorbosone dehydrogenase [Dehalococcoidia bacterium]